MSMLDSALLPLALLYIAANRRSANTLTPRSAAPPWPTPNSPPPMPAFTSQPTPSADPSQSSTPLADLHNAPPKLAPASSNQPGNVKARQRASTPASIKQKAVQAFKQKATQQLKQRLATNAVTQAATRGVSPSSLLSSALTFNSNSATSVPVSDLQSILNTRGVKVVKDGLYGPKTAAAWSKLAKSKGLSPTISRVGPKTAKVVTRTYDSLQTPPIP